MDETSGIFISYRRDDAQGWAVLLRDQLAGAFGEERVFFAPDALGPGLWREQIDRALTQSKAVLVVIGKGWLNAVDDSGELRLLQPGDVHRQEIEMALARSAITVVPVLVDRAAMPRREELPQSIASLFDRQAFELSDVSDRLRADLKKLVSHVAQITGLTPKPVKPPIGLRHRLLAIGALLLAAFLTSVAVMVAGQTVLGWNATPEESSGIFLIVFSVLLMISRWRARAKEAREHATG